MIDKDHRENSRVTSFANLVFIKESNSSLGSISDALLKKQIGYMWDDVSNGISYEAVDFRPKGGTSSSTKNLDLLRAKYYHNLYINNIEPIYNDEVNNVTSIYKYFFNTIPLTLSIVIILLTYNSINKEKRIGSLKLILTQAIDRSKYYISKWISSVIHLIIIVLIPPFVVSIASGISNGFITLKYPTFYLTNILTRLAPIPNYFDIVAGKNRVPELLPRVFGHIAPAYTIEVEPGPEIDMIPFYLYLLTAIFLLILFIMFMVAFVQLISALIDNELISLFTVSALVGLITYISWPFTKERTYNLSPFTFFRISRIIEGTHNVTVLTSSIILILSTAILITYRM